MPSPPTRSAAAGLAWTLAAYVAWGLLPVYFRALASVPPLEILGQRILWSVLFLVLALSALGRWEAVAAVAHRPRQIGTLALTALLISTNWVLFIWAVSIGRVLDTSLGYFMTPLVNVLLAVAILREPLSGRQVAAVLLAAAGVLWLVAAAGHLPWISLGLALSFGGYGLLRKRAGIDSVAGLSVETAILSPLAAAWLGHHARSGAAHLDPATGIFWLLAALGPLTALPLIWFGVGVQRLRLSTVGLLQYVSPSLQLAVAVLLFGEAFTRAHAVAFGCIWASLALYTAEALRAARKVEQSGRGRVRAP